MTMPPPDGLGAGVVVVVVGAGVVAVVVGLVVAVGVVVGGL